jgi:endonuclease/exonuclease/phosphatase family metal-dependent hydrolase
MMSKANIRVVDSKSHLKEMSQGAGYDGKRDFLEATFETDTGFRFTVYNAHCRSMRGGEAKTAPIRMQEVGNAAKILKAHIAKNPQAPIFVTGDFNTNHDTPHGKPVIELITHLGKPQEEPEFTEVMLKDGKADPTHNGYNNHPNNKLDYIFTSKSMLPQIRKAYVAGDFQQNPWKQASDHLPYITEFEELPVPAKKPLEANNQGNKAEKGAPFTAEDKDQQIQSNIVPAPRTPKLNREPKRRKLHLNA